MNSALWKTCAATSALVLALSLSHSARAQEHEQSAHHGFHNVEHWVQVFESPERAKWQKPDEVVRALHLRPGQVVADIGAGTGYFTLRFARAVAPTGEAIGLDIEPAMVAYMKADAKRLQAKNYRARLVKPDDPEFASRSVDVVFFCDTLHHLEHRVAYFRRLAPVLKPGGRVVVIDFKKKPLPVGPPPADKISREEMISEFRTAGYRLVREHHFLPYQYFLEFEPKSHA
jgi:ubiquinone/menaquinone biosynthesis C-methylase UbiE